MNKKYLLFIMCLVITIGNCCCVFGEDFNGDMTVEEGARAGEYDPEGTVDYKLGSEARISLPLEYTIPVTYFIQDNEYYCGPATVKQVLHYINGSSLSQDSYAQSLGTTEAGTDMTRIVDVLNSNQSSKTYTYASIGTQTNWELMVKHSTYWGTPAIIDINTSDYSSDFLYASTGHFVNISGYDYSSATHKVQITDPYWVNPGNHWYDSSVLYGANNAHFRKAIIW